MRHNNVHPAPTSLAFKKDKEQEIIFTARTEKSQDSHTYVPVSQSLLLPDMHSHEK